MAGRKPLTPFTFERILQQASVSLSSTEPSSNRAAYYIASYPALIEAAQILSAKPAQQTIYALYRLAYGWMPTTPRHTLPDAIKTNSIPSISAVRDAKTQKDALAILLDHPKHAPINNSWIGTSKRLHFVNPAVFPIWDSKIAGHYGMSAHSTYNSKRHYITYLQNVHELTTLPALAAFQSTLALTHKYKVTKIRAVELALFLTPSPSP